MAGRVIAFLLLASAVPPAAAAQVFDAQGNRLRQLAYYVWGDPSDTKVAVQVWGAVSNPGLYDVRTGTRLSTVLTLAGPQVGSRARRSDRTMMIRLFRPTPTGELAPVFAQTMTNDLVALDEDLVLQEGDYVTVDMVVRDGFSWRDGLRIISAAGSLALVVDRIFLDR